MKTQLETRAEKIVHDARWPSVASRDRAADGRFVYAVRTTRIYCRPACAARTPKPQNVEFFTDAAAAERAGYRACKRCRPAHGDAPTALTLRMRALAEYIRAHAGESLSLTRLAKQAALSPTHLQRTFKAALGVSPKEFQAAVRLDGFKARLRRGQSVLDATFATGYGSTSRSYALIDGGLGMTPTAYRSGGAGETIAYAVRDTALGLLLMAATGRGVCAVQFGATPVELVAALQGEFPRARLRPAGADAEGPLNHWITALNAHLNASGPRPDLPLDLRGTAFQIKVWRFLLSIKPGAAISYTELAQGIKAPRAVRAAASACGLNRIAVLIPCHRVLRSDGGLGGYRWGIERKRTLLDAERRRR